MVMLQWESPRITGCPIKDYFVCYREIQANGSRSNWTREHVKDAETRQYKLSLQCRRRYEVGIIARNAFGESHLEPLQITTTGMQGSVDTT